MEHHNEPKGGEHSPENDTGPERTVPSIYVASLADYNHGVLHGDWLNATVEPDELHEQIRAILARSQQPNAEEWAIHGYEGFCGLDIDEHENLESVFRLATGIAQHGEAFAIYADWVGFENAKPEEFGDHHAGSYESLGACARELADSLGWEHQVEQFADESGIGPYVVIDYEALAEDLRHEWHIVETDRGVHVFYP